MAVSPSFEMASPRGYAQSPSLDGSRPGAYYINLVDTQIWPRWALPTLTYHESLPGHHLQGALALEATDTPLLLKSMGFNAYGEGWGLYAEQLADELGSVREMVSRLLKGFAEQGLVRLGREQVEVLDAAGLRKLASVT